MTNIHRSPTGGNFCEEHRKAQKLALVTNYNQHIGYNDDEDRMANTYLLSQRTWEVDKKIFFYLLDLTTLTSYIILSPCGFGSKSQMTFLEGQFEH